LASFRGSATSTSLMSAGGNSITVALPMPKREEKGKATLRLTLADKPVGCDAWLSAAYGRGQCRILNAIAGGGREKRQGADHNGVRIDKAVSPAFITSKFPLGNVRSVWSILYRGRGSTFAVANHV